MERMPVGSVFAFAHSYRAFVAALDNGERCEIDEAMFVHWLETMPPLCMQRDVVLADLREVHADFVLRSRDGAGTLQAFWHRREGDNEADRRYFAQRAL